MCSRDHDKAASPIRGGRAGGNFAEWDETPSKRDGISVAADETTTAAHERITAPQALPILTVTSRAETHNLAAEMSVSYV
jgi:hypothetical protein